MLIKKIVGMCIILVIAILIPASAQTKETLAVLDFNTEAVSKTEMSAIVEFLSNELFRTDKYIVIDVSQRETILQEMEFSMQGCSDDSCALEIGKMLSAELIVVGTLSKIGSRYLMSAKMLETETSRTVGTANGKYTDLDEMIDGLEKIAYSLAGQEVVSTETEGATDETSEPVKPETVEQTGQSAPPEPEVQPESGTGINWISFGLSSVGALSMVGSGIFDGLAESDIISARNLYDLYMQTDVEPGQFYSGENADDYEHYYSLYERDLIISLASAGAGGLFMGSAVSTGENYFSAGGRLAAAGGMLCIAAGNLLSSMAGNSLAVSEKIYDDYQSAVGASVIDDLFEEYNSYYEKYRAQRYISYSLWGVGAAARISSYFIPGEKTAEYSSPLAKILSAAGSIMIAGGNFSSTVAFNKLIRAEDAFETYQSAGITEIVDSTWQEYENLQNQYELQTYISYGLWGLGAAAMVTSLFLPEAKTEKTAATLNDAEWYLRPAMTGLGIEAVITLK